MKLPKLRTLSASRQMVDTFQGYNHNLRIGDGEFFDMKNMTSDLYPVLSPRGNRGVYACPDSPKGLIAKDALCYVDGSKFVINDYAVDMKLATTCDACPRKNDCSAYEVDKPACNKQLVSMGAYVIIMPDKKWINTANWDGETFNKEGGWGSMEAYFNETGKSLGIAYEMCKIDGTAYTGAHKGLSAPEDPKSTPLWIDQSTTPHVLKQYSETNAVWVPIATTYIKISAPNIAQNFSQYDAVKISGFPQESKQLSGMNDVVYPLWDAYHDPGDAKLSRNEGTDDYIIIAGILDEAVTYESALRLERTMPVMDFVIESGNRLWGCRYGQAANGQMVNEIYCSKLGDFKNWECSMGISTDSWVGGCGTDGQFTGAITHMGYPLFFKENCVHKVYGKFPTNFQIQTTVCRGVQKGCEKSLAIVNETLFYKSRNGICAYDGSLPNEVSYTLGNEVYSQAVGGAHGNKYYISMLDAAATPNLFVFDTAKGLWHKEDDLKVDCFCSCDGEMYALCDDGKIVTLLGTGTKDTAPVQWMVETGDMGLSSPDTKYISRLTLRMAMDIGAQVRISAQYDFSPAWESLGSIRGNSLHSFSLPIRPKRCDHMRLRIEGEGMVKIYSITKTIEQGSDIT